MNKKTDHMDTVKIFNTLVEQYNKALSNSDAKAIDSFLKSQDYKLINTDVKLYIEVLTLRAQGFTLFGNLIDANKEYQEAYNLSSAEDKSILGLNWALTFLTELSINRGSSAVKESFNLAVLVINDALKYIEKSNQKTYCNLALCGLKSFMLLSIQKPKEAKEALSSVDFVPVPVPEYNDQDSLNFLFANFTKNLAVAIELKDTGLLLSMLNVIAIDDPLMMSDAPLFQKFYSTLVTTFDMRPEFINEFNTLFKIKGNFQSILPNFANMLSLVGDQKFDQLALFFDEFS